MRDVWGMQVCQGIAYRKETARVNAVLPPIPSNLNGFQNFDLKVKARTWP